MNFSDPSRLCRRVYLDLSTGRPRALFRHNASNLKARWGKPVPSAIEPYGPVLIFDHSFAPIAQYGKPLLEASALYPIDTSGGEIDYTPYPIDAEAIHRLRTDPHALGMTPVDRQTYFRDLRNRTTQALVHKLMEQIGSNPAYRYVEDVIREVSIRLGLGTDTVMKIMRDLENFSFTPRPPKVIVNKRNATMPWLNRSDWRFPEVVRALAVLRVSKLPKETISIDDLAAHSDAIAGAAPITGGFPNMCPVIGMEFEWGVHVNGQMGVSIYSPKIGRYDITQPYAPGNVVLMSAWARRLVEGFGSPSRLAPLLLARPELLERIKEWDARHPIPHLPTFLKKIEKYKPPRPRYGYVEPDTDTPNTDTPNTP